MISLNLFKKPISKDTVLSWAKILDDVAKVAIIALPTVLYGNFSITFKVVNICVLFLIIYAILWLSNFARSYINEMTLQEK